MERIQFLNNNKRIKKFKFVKKLKKCEYLINNFLN